MIDFDFASIETWPYKLVIPEGVISIEAHFSDYFKYGGNEVRIDGTETQRLWETYGEDFCATMVCPSTLVKIGESALSNSIKFKEIKLNEGLKIIEWGGFRASSVPQIKLPSTVEEIGGAAFCGTSAKTIELNEGLLKIGYDSFADTRVKTLVLPESLREITKHPAVVNYRNVPSYDYTSLLVPGDVKFYQKVRCPFFTNTPFLRNEFSQYTEAENRSNVRSILEYVIASLSHEVHRCINRSQYLSLIRRFTPEKRQLIENLGEICAMRELPAELGMMIIEHCGTPSRYRDARELIKRDEELVKEARESGQNIDPKEPFSTVKMLYNNRLKEIEAEKARDHSVTLSSIDRKI